MLYLSKGDMKVTSLPADTPKLAKHIVEFITGFAGEVRVCSPSLPVGWQVRAGRVNNSKRGRL